MMEKVLEVRGMTCNHCKASVTTALTQLVGVTRVEVDLSIGRVQVDHDAAKLDESALRRAIEAIGFDVG